MVSELHSALRAALRERYDVEREIGRGGMAIVYLARDRKHNRRVALKVLSPALTTAVASERFLREIQITARLQHPHILPLLDSGEAMGFLYYVMPYVEGETLRERLLIERRLTVPHALLIAREAAEALDYAHRQGIIHRDVKPENIMLSNGHTIVADFGIARAVDMAAGQTLTGSGLPLGTAAYMSPEQVAGSHEVDGRSDVYSLGCVLYEMLAGRTVFGGANLREILTRHATATATPIAELRPDISPLVAECVSRAIAKDPRDRFQTAGEMAEQLRLALGEPPRILTPPGGYAEPTWSSGRGRVTDPAARTAVAGMGGGRWLMVAAAAAGIALAMTMWLPGRSAQDREGAARVVASADPATTVPAGRSPVSGSLPNREAAREAYRNGTYWLERRSERALRNAITAFSEAVRLDSAYAPAYAGLARAQTLSVIYGYRSAADPYAELAEALHRADRAVQLDSGLAEAYNARAVARSTALYPDDVVAADVHRARALAPNAAEIRMTFAQVLFRAGALDSSLREATAALVRNPRSPGLRHSLAALALGARRYDIAVREARRARVLDRSDAVAVALEGYALLLARQPHRCVALDLRLLPALRAMCLQSVGRVAEATALVDSLSSALLEEQYGIVHQYADLAAYYAWRGEVKPCIRWLERSVAHSPMLHRWHLSSGLFDRVRDSPEFQAELARLRTLIQDRLRAQHARLAG